MEPSRDISRLIEIMAALRAPVGGCPWDLEQSFETIAPYTIEEAYEVAEAIAEKDMRELCVELGDLLLQVVYHARLAEEIGAFAFPDVVEAITRKLIRRHPHVFGDEVARAAGAAKGFWEKIKADEKRESAAVRGGEAGAPGLLDGVPAALPALVRAIRLQEKASTVGFDWNDPRAVLAKIREEIGEIEAELDRAAPARERVADEIGDLLFAVANLARHLKVDAEQALRGTSAKFVRRFRSIEAALAAEGRSPRDSSLAEMEALWQKAKAAG
ncbi:MAG TPA: nucleoside triphosphate pyrophosphohydrolase [Bauldia sp.]|nr:nucleoside triphosphate pyrophosphohydrolase [Bauldia sp.]